MMKYNTILSYIVVIVTISNINALKCYNAINKIGYNHHHQHHHNHHNHHNHRSNSKLMFSLSDQLTDILTNIGNIDQYIQGALNSATDTAPLIASQPLTTQVPELNILTNVNEETGTLYPLGNDLLIFLCATIGIVPLFKWLKASPVIGFLSAGLLMGPAGLKLFSDLDDM